MILLFLINYEAYLHANAKDVVASLSFFAERRGQPLSRIPEREPSALQWEVEEQGDWHSSEGLTGLGRKGGSWIDVVCVVLHCGLCVLNLCSELSGKSSQEVEVRVQERGISWLSLLLESQTLAIPAGVTECRMLGLLHFIFFLFHSTNICIIMKSKSVSF